MMNINRFAIISFITAAIITVVFSFSAAVKAQESGFDKSAVIFYRTGDIRHDVVAEVIRRYNPRLNDNKASIITEAILKESGESGLDPFLITAVIAAESSFRPNVVSPCHAMGLMQLTKGVLQAFQLNNPFDIQQNIHGGSRYLHYLKQRFGRDELILAAYNSGPTRVARLGRVPRIRETIRYIQKITVLRHLMSGKWNSVLQNTLTNPVILPFSEGISSDGMQPSFGKAAGSRPTVKSSTFGFSLIQAFSDNPEVSHPILDTRRMLVFG